MPSTGGSGLSRETRLLAATIGVSIVVLVVLSRFRFPDVLPDARDGAAAQPLARLAARAAFDDLSLAVRELSGRVSGSLLVVRSTGPTPPADTTHNASRDGARLIPALRVRDDVAVVLTGETDAIDAVVGVAGPVTILARDVVRGLTLVRVPAAPAPVLAIRDGQQPIATPSYLAVAEASEAGTSIRPLFVGRSDGLGDPRWDTSLITVGRGAAADIGAPVFTLDGRLAGLLESSDGMPALVPASVVLAAVDQLLRSGTPPVGDIGVVTQDLDPLLEAATGVTAGAAIVAVGADGPAAQAFFPGDVITALNGQPVRSPDALRLRVTRAAPGSALSMTVRRDGGFFTAPVTVRARPAAPAQPASTRTDPAQGERSLGLTTRELPGRGSEITRVQPGSVAESAGLRAGDVVVSLGRTRAPTPSAIADAYAGLAAGRALLIAVERDTQPRLVALRR